MTDKHERHKPHKAPTQAEIEAALDWVRKDEDKEVLKSVRDALDEGAAIR